MYLQNREVSSTDGAIVRFADGKAREFTEEAVKHIVTESPTDPNEFQALCIEPVIKELVEYFRNVEKFDDSEEKVEEMRDYFLSVLERYDVRVGVTFLKDTDSDHRIISERVNAEYQTAMSEICRRALFSLSNVPSGTVTTNGEEIIQNVIEYLKTVDLMSTTEEVVDNAKSNMVLMLSECSSEMRVSLISEIHARYLQPFAKVVTYVGYTLEDTLKTAVSKAFDMQTSAKTLDAQLRNIRISDIKRVKSSN